MAIEQQDFELAKESQAGYQQAELVPEGTPQAGADALSVAPATMNAVVPKETANARDYPAPALEEFDNPQLHLFQHFLCNNEEEHDQLSNAIDLWDCVPRYSVSRQAMNKARIADRFLDEHKASFQHRGRSYTLIVHPASITDLDGQSRYYYPSAGEELVEDSLRKIAVEQQAGYFDKSNYRSGVLFTLYALREEMKKRGHTRSYQEIVQSLNILSHCVIDIIPQGAGEARITSACFASLAAVSRTRLKDDPQAKWAVQFHPLVTAAIDQVTHRQYNYRLMMSHTTQLARWLHKQLVLKFTFADQFKPFQMRHSTVKRDSGLLSGYARNRDGTKALEQAFAELLKRGVISRYQRQDETGERKKLLDAVFTIRPSMAFIREAKAANARQQRMDAGALGQKAVGLGRGSSQKTVGLGRGWR